MRTRDNRRSATGVNKAECRLDVGDRRSPARGTGSSRPERGSIERVDRKEQQPVGRRACTKARQSITDAAEIGIEAYNLLIPEQDDPRIPLALREPQRRLNGNFGSDTVRVADRQCNGAHSGMAKSVFIREISQTTMRWLSLAMSPLIA